MTVLRLRDHAYATFTERLLARDIVPGQIVSQRELVALTGMTLGAIRDMIPRLEVDGLIRTIPKRGLQVLTIDLGLVRDAYQMRAMIEGEAIAAFCHDAPDAAVARIAASHRDMHARLAAGVTPDLLEEAQRFDWAFHDEIVDAMGNAIVSDIHRVNAIKIRLIRNADTRMLPELAVSVLEEHLAITESLHRRDAPAAVGAMRRHIDSARRRALGL